MKYLILVFLALAACDSGSKATATTTTQDIAPAAAAQQAATAPQAEAKAEKACDGNCKNTNPSYFYSPFVVSLAGNHPFKVVSFKDVGLKRATPVPNDPLLEVIAESVAQHLSQSTLNVEAAVSYDEAILDPNNHVACGSDHLYVDIWRSGDTKFGYSLWSGCGEDDNFAWKEVPATFEPDDLATVVEPLAASITETLSAATAKSCFQKTC